MRKRVIGSLVAALVSVAGTPLCAATPATSATPAAAAVPAASVTLPFAPPLATPVRFAYDHRALVGDAQRQRLRSVEELIFTRRSDGNYDLRWETLSVAVEAPGPVQALLEKVYGIGVGAALLLTVDARGGVLAISNAAEIRALSERMMATMLAGFDSETATLPAADRDMLKQMLTTLLDQQRQMSDAVFTESLLENPRMLLPGLGAMVPGRVEARDVEAESPFGGTIRFLSQVELRRHDPGQSAEIRVSSVANPEDARRASEAFLARMIAAIPDPEQRRRAEAETANMGALAISDEAVITLALPSGLAEAVQYRKQVTLPGQPVRLDERSYVRSR